MQRNTTGDDGLELWPDSASAANIGIMLFRKGAGKLAKVGQTCLILPAFSCKTSSSDIPGQVAPIVAAVPGHGKPNSHSIIEVEHSSGVPYHFCKCCMAVAAAFVICAAL